MGRVLGSISGLIVAEMHSNIFPKLLAQSRLLLDIAIGVDMMLGSPIGFSVVSHSTKDAKYIILANLAIADGLCAIDISLLASAPDAHASGVQLYTAAYVMISACAGNSPSQGGVALDIGKFCYIILD